MKKFSNLIKFLIISGLGILFVITSVAVVKKYSTDTTVVDTGGSNADSGETIELPDSEIEMLYVPGDIYL